MGALTEKGFKKPTYAELLARQVARAKEYFGSDMDTGELTALGKFIRLIVYDLAELYEDMEGIYFARFPNHATGINLDRLMPFAGIHRNPAVAAVHVVRFSGMEGASIPAGFQVSTSDGIVFHTEKTIIIGEEGTVTEAVACNQRGVKGNVAPGSISVIVNPSVQVESVEHVEQVVEGRAEETDYELRKRFSKAILGIGSATMDAIRGEILRVSGVLSCVMIENDMTTATGAGLPPHSFEAYIHGDAYEDGDVAQAIFAKKPLGIKSYGTVEVSVEDEQGAAHTVYFSRVVQEDVYIKATVSVDNFFPSNGIEQIQDALAAYINGFSNGVDVVFTTLYPYIMGVAGVRDVPGLRLSTDGVTYTTNNILIGPEKVAFADRANIAIEVQSYVDG